MAAGKKVAAPKKGLVRVHSRDADGNDKEEYFDVPEALGKLADHAFAVNERKRALAAQADLADAELKAILHYMESRLKKDALSGFQGKRGRLMLQPKTAPRVEDWDALYKHIKRTGSFDLLQRRLGEKAVAERWDDGREVPGVGRWDYMRLSVTAAKVR